MGIEPTANWLRANCSTTELLTQVKRLKQKKNRMIVEGLPRNTMNSSQKRANSKSCRHLFHIRVEYFRKFPTSIMKKILLFALSSLFLAGCNPTNNQATVDPFALPDEVDSDAMEEVKGDVFEEAEAAEPVKEEKWGCGS